jgi:hypothetical protein
VLRIVRKSRERLIAEGYEAQLAERERVVQLLAEQVEYLRAQLHMPTSTVTMAAATPAPPALDFSDLPDDIKLEAMNALSDEEEELLAMRQAHVISQAEYDQAIDRLTSRTPDDIIE